MKTNMVRDIIVEVMIPQNMMYLYCSRQLTLNSHKDVSLDPSKFPNGIVPDKYNLKNIDPERLREIIKIVQTSPSTRFHIVERPENEDIWTTVDKYNESVHYVNPITVSDIVKMIDWTTYKWTRTGKDEKYLGEEMHEFHKIMVPGISKNRATSLYVKFITPVDGEDITVVSVHQ